MLKKSLTKFNTHSLKEIMDTRNIPKHNKAIYSKPTVNIKLNGEKLKGIPIKSGTRQDCPLFPYLFSIVLKILAKAIRQQKGIRRHKLGRKNLRFCYLQMI